MSQNIVKKQHYVPRSYLRRFSERHDNNIEKPNDKKNKLIVYDKENNIFYYSTVNNSGSVNYFYNIESAPSIEKKQAIETFYLQWSMKHQNLLRNLFHVVV